MQNQLVQWLEEKRGDQSIRKFSKSIGLSHAYVTDVLKGKSPVTWNFAAQIADKTGLEPMQAFTMAGLWPPTAEEFRAAKAEFGQKMGVAGND